MITEWDHEGWGRGSWNPHLPLSLSTLDSHFWPSTDLIFLSPPGCVTLGSKVTSLCSRFLLGKMGVVTDSAFLRAMT